MGLVTPGIGLVFWMLLSFSIVLIILKKYAWKPILKMLKERETSIESALTAAEEAKNEMAKLKADNDKILAEARLERDSILKEAREIKDKIVGEAKEQANAEASKILNESKQQLELQKSQAMTEIKNEVAKLSIEIAEKILRKDLSKESKQEELIEDLLKDIKFN
ncbi:MAG: ATP synthase F0 subunit B [Marinilabiliales bacterium]|nr:MAG: ATP synthase F0 subunit B [Marinilabiliales bacterium]